MYGFLTVQTVNKHKDMNACEWESEYWQIIGKVVGGGVIWEAKGNQETAETSKYWFFTRPQLRH